MPSMATSIGRKSSSTCGPTVRSDTVALVRLAERNVSLVKRALDIGADGVVIPWVETADQLRELVAFANYPPRGVRGIGAERATGWGQCIAEHIAEANEHVLVVPIIESVRGGQNIGEMLKVDGVDLFFLGRPTIPARPASPASGKGRASPSNCWRSKTRSCGPANTAAWSPPAKPTSSNAASRASACSASARTAACCCGACTRCWPPSGATEKCNTSLTPSNASPDAPPLDRPPESFRPDRPEVMNDFGSGKKIEIQPGVVFECLVGAHNSAKNLTTGVVRFAPAVKLAYHTHPTTESITLLAGSAIVDVEGRRYRLAPFDNVVVPPGVPHGVENASPEREALASRHLSDRRAVARTCWNQSIRRDMMPDDSTGPCTPGWSGSIDSRRPSDSSRPRARRSSTFSTKI